MSATVLSSPAGTARQLATGGWAVNLGDLVPVWCPDRESAWDLLDVSPVLPAGPDDLVRSSSNKAWSGSFLLDP